VPAGGAALSKARRRYVPSPGVPRRGLSAYSSITIGAPSVFSACNTPTDIGVDPTFTTALRDLMKIPVDKGKGEMDTAYMVEIFLGKAD
jgi:hypothetical protein